MVTSSASGRTGAPSAPGSRQCLPYGDRHLQNLPVVQAAALSVVLTSLLTGVGTGQRISECLEALRASSDLPSKKEQCGDSLTGVCYPQAIQAGPVRSRRAALPKTLATVEGENRHSACPDRGQGDHLTREEARGPSGSHRCLLQCSVAFKARL